MINFLKGSTLLKYSMVGLSGTAIDILMLYVLVHFMSINVILAASVSFIFAATNNFIFNNSWTFKKLENEYRYQSNYFKYLKFIFVSVVGLIFTIIFMFIFNKILFVWYIFSKILTSLVVLLWNYYVNKNWTFKIYV